MSIMRKPFEISCATQLAYQSLCFLLLDSIFVGIILSKHRPLADCTDEQADSCLFMKTIEFSHKVAHIYLFVLPFWVSCSSVVVFSSVCKRKITQDKNIAKSEQSSHTPGGIHQRPYHFNWKEGKNQQLKELISNMWLNFLYTVQLVISDVCTKFQNSRSSRS